MVIGIDIGGMTFKVGFVENGKILFKYTLVTDKTEQQEQSIERLGKSLIDTIKEHHYSLIKGIGVSCAGVINAEKGYCDYSPNLGWKNLNICSILKTITGLPTLITNDANAAAYAEAKYGAGKYHDTSVTLTLGTGIGGGVVINGKLFEGVEGKGTELGHMVLKMGGIKCGCGRNGCFEAYASATALIRQTKEAMKKDNRSLLWEYAKGNINNVGGKNAFECAKLKDVTALKVIDKYVTYLSEGILNFCNIFRPNIIILGGGISYQGDYLLEKVNYYCKEHNWGLLNSPSVEIKIASLGNDAGIIGAACLFE
ncbi:MAG: ROK family protein [Bacillales bacterium]|jgi:glucokinase|nr:ROK family protein [Bacillales bacterium]